MAKTQVRSAIDTAVIVIFFIVVSLALLSPLWVFKDLLFPFITSKAFMFRGFIEAALPFYVYLLIKRPELRPAWRNPLILTMLVFVVINLITSLTGVNINRSIWGNFERMGGTYYLTHLVLLAMYIILLAQIGGKYIKYILYVAFAVAAFISLNGVSGWLGGPIVVQDPSLPSRVSSTLGNPIFLGSFLILPMFLAGFFALQAEKTWGKVVFWSLAGLFLVGIILSVTRGALVGLIAGCFFAAVVFVIFYPNRNFKIYGSTALLVLAAFVISVFVLHSKLPQNQFTRLFQLQGSDTQARFLQWRTALRGFKDKPLLGVGPENYYYIANKYYNPQMVLYDPSWFDKPHNYILEVLVTTGVFGFLAYASLNVLVLWALYRAYRAGFLSLMQMCLLVAGFLSYLVQNLFVFDTIPASMMFYAFVGFSAYLWAEVSALQKDKAAMQHNQNLSTLALVSAVVAGIVAVYTIYVTNIIPAGVAKDVNYGYAYSSVNPSQSYSYFQDAIHSSFNFDPQDTAQRYSDLAPVVVQSQQLDPPTIQQMVSDITNYQKQVAESIGNDPISWQKLANDYLLEAFANRGTLDPAAIESAKRAISLVPNRIEPELELVQIYMSESDLHDAGTELDKINEVVPLTDYTASARWLKVYLDHLLKQDVEGVAMANQLVSGAYPPTNFQLASWIYDYYYATKKDYPNAVVWGQYLTQWFPTEPVAKLTLAQAYIKTGQISQAKTLLQQLIDTNASNKADAQALLQSIQ